MSICDHNIITHSSFSWWAAWLNNNNKKIVIVPGGKLFGPQGPTDTDDYYPDDFTKI